MSETVLSEKNLRLTRGEFSLESTPLAAKEKFAPLQFTAGGQSLSTSEQLATTATVAVGKEETLLTVRKCQLSGVNFPDFSGESPQAGQSVLLSNSQFYRTGLGGHELPPLPFSAPRADEFGGLLAERG
jgi:hypothetical protein